MTSRSVSLSLILAAATACAARADWPMYGGDAQHSGISSVPAQDLDQIRFSTAVDTAPPSGILFVHYGSPLITPLNTLLVAQKTSSFGDFQLQAFNAFNPTSSANPTPLWSMTIPGYLSPPHDWFPPYAPTLTPQNKLYLPGPAGTLYCATGVDGATAPALHQTSFYTNTPADNSNVFVNTPLTAAANGDVYYGVDVNTPVAGGVQSCLVRAAADGTFHTFNVAAAIPGMNNIVQNCAPAISRDGKTIYVAVSTGNGTSLVNNGYLVALDANTLALKAAVSLKDPVTGNMAFLPDEGTSSPTIGPDGDVYFGVLENSFGSHNARGWMLHFSADLSTQKTPGSFGWDDTMTIVPASMVPGYTATAGYLLMTKYNNYAGSGTGDGTNKIAILDPAATELDPINGTTTVMKEVITQLGPTPEPADGPNAVKEWCINSAAIDPATNSVMANSEDGSLYRWNTATNTITQSLKLTDGIGEAYTPTLIGPDGTVYAINDAVLFATGSGATSRIDLANNFLLLHNVPIAAAMTRLHDGYNGGAWNGAGLVSSTAAITPNTALGAVSGKDFLTLHPGQQFQGQSVTDTDALLMYTITGDADLDGQLTLGDFALIDAGFFAQLTDPTWVNGDFNYDGVVDYRDYALIDAAFDQIDGPLAAAIIAQHTAEFGGPYLADLQALEAVAPEPATLALAALGTVALLRRTRR